MKVLDWRSLVQRSERAARSCPDARVPVYVLAGKQRVPVGFSAVASRFVRDRRGDTCSRTGYLRQTSLVLYTYEDIDRY